MKLKYFLDLAQYTVWFEDVVGYDNTFYWWYLLLEAIIV